MPLLLALYVSLFLLLKILLTDNALFFNFFLFEPKKSEEKARRQQVNTQKYVLSFIVSLVIEIFFLLVLFSRVSVIIQGGTTIPELCGYYCRPSRTEEKNKRKNKDIFLFCYFYLIIRLKILIISIFFLIIFYFTTVNLLFY